MGVYRGALKKKVDSFQNWWNRNSKVGGTLLAPSVEHATLDLVVVSFEPHVGYRNYLNLKRIVKLGWKIIKLL